MRGESYTSLFVRIGVYNTVRSRNVSKLAGIRFPLGSRTPLIVHGQLARFTVPSWSGP